MNFVFVFVSFVVKHHSCLSIIILYFQFFTHKEHEGSNHKEHKGKDNKLVVNFVFVFVSFVVKHHFILGFKPANFCLKYVLRTRPS